MLVEAGGQSYRQDMALKATVRNGRLSMDYPTNLPEGTEIQLVMDDRVEETSEEELAPLNRALLTAAESLDAERGVDGQALLARLRAKSS